MRLGAIFIALCIVLIAGSLGAVLYLSVGLTATEASVVAIALLSALLVYNAASARVRDQDTVSQQIADLSRGTAELARQVGDLSRRLDTAEAAALSASERVRHATAPIAREMETLGNLVRQLAESVAAHEAALAANAMRGAMPGRVREPARQETPESGANNDVGELREPEPERLASGRVRGLDRDQVVASIAAAVEANRLDLHLQPIVSLPQRKVRFYEAMLRLRNENGEVMTPAEFVPSAEAAGLMPKIDNLVLFRCVQVVRRLLTKKRDVGVFCQVSATTLSDPEYFPQLADFMEANRALASALVLELAQTTLRSMGPLESEGLAALAQLGFRFSLDRLTDLRVAPRDLAERGFRFVKAPAALLLNRGGSQAADIHPADFSGLLARFGIDLIAEDIESEGTLVDLLDYDVKFGQGLLFSPPRPVRPEATAGPDRSEPAGSLGGLRESLENGPEAGKPEPRPDRRAGMLAQLARGMVRRG